MRFNLTFVRNNTTVDENNCWNWAGCSSAGYGRISNADGQTGLVYKRLWELLYGPVEIGKQLDHMCRNRLCVNPDHLRVVTPSENRLNSSWVNQNVGKEYCSRGHAFDEDNTYIDPSSGERGCKECRRDAVRRYRARNFRNRRYG